jgi:hypothetical protein
VTLCLVVSGLLYTVGEGAGFHDRLLLPSDITGGRAEGMVEGRVAVALLQRMVGAVEEWWSSMAEVGRGSGPPTAPGGSSTIAELPCDPVRRCPWAKTRGMVS